MTVATFKPGDRGHVEEHNYLRTIVPAAEAARDEAVAARDAAEAVFGRRTNRVALLGDSITDANKLYDVGGGAWTTPGAGYFWQANMFVRDAMTLALEAGVSGNTTAQILARVGDVVAATPDLCVVVGGTNDILAAVPYATTIANLTAICEALRAAGILVALGEVIPSTQINTATELDAAGRINQWVTDYARTTPGIVPVRWAAGLTDPATGAPLTGMTYDGTHPTSTGAAFMGRVLADAIRPHLVDINPLDYSNTDAANGLTNGLMLGDTAGVADGLAITAKTGSPVYAPRKRTRTDGHPGEWQEVDLTSGEIYLRAVAAGGGAAWTTGDSVYFACEVDTETDFDAITKFEVSLRGLHSGGSLVQQAMGLFDSYTSPRRPPVDRGVIRTHPLTVTAAMASLQPSLYVAGTGVFRTSAWTVRRVEA